MGAASYLIPVVAAQLTKASGEVERAERKKRKFICPSFFFRTHRLCILLFNVFFLTKNLIPVVAAQLTKASGEANAV